MDEREVWLRALLSEKVPAEHSLDFAEKAANAFRERFRKAISTVKDQYLSIPLKSLDLSARPFNLLQRHHAKTIGDVERLISQNGRLCDWMSEMGETSSREIESKMRKAWDDLVHLSEQGSRSL